MNDRPYTVPASTVHGDQINQSGVANIGKVETLHGGVIYHLAGTSEAITELTDFLAYLRQTGVITSTGRVPDAFALQNAVVKRRSVLRRVMAAIASGARRTVVGAVDDVAAGMVLEAIEEIM